MISSIAINVFTSLLSLGEKRSLIVLFYILGLFSLLHLPKVDGNPHQRMITPTPLSHPLFNVNLRGSLIQPLRNKSHIDPRTIRPRLRASRKPGEPFRLHPMPFSPSIYQSSLRQERLVELLPCLYMCRMAS